MLKIFKSSQIKGVDLATIKNEPIQTIDLMERASNAFYSRFTALCPEESVLVLAGPGNNGGDALAVARFLINDNRDVRIFLLRSSAGDLSSDAAINLERLMKLDGVVVNEVDETTILNLKNGEWIIDGLFGSGLNKPVQGVVAKLIEEVNQQSNKIVSIDMPSGLFDEENKPESLKSCIRADYTITFQNPKLAFFLVENSSYVGKWEVVDIQLDPTSIKATESDYYMIQRSDVQQMLKKRQTFDHKGHYGHALLMAGSYGKMGAAILASRACLKSGVGLLTTHVPRLGNSIIQMAVPEAMASTDRSDILISEHPCLNSFKAIGIGPGIGLKPNTVTAVKELLENLDGKPIVIDADGINILAKESSFVELLKSSTVLTPHPGEFDRLAGASENGYERLQKAIDYARAHNVVIVLKGAYTAVINGDGKCCFNTTGNPGMATAGSGDVLTGIILALLAQGYLPYEAAQLGVYMHGAAADEYVITGSMEDLTASDIYNSLGRVFRKLHQ